MLAGNTTIAVIVVALFGFLDAVGWVVYVVRDRAARAERMGG